MPETHALPPQPRQWRRAKIERNRAPARGGDHCGVVSAIPRQVIRINHDDVMAGGGEAVGVTQQPWITAELIGTENADPGHRDQTVDDATASACFQLWRKYHAFEPAT